MSMAAQMHRAFQYPLHLFPSVTSTILEGIQETLLVCYCSAYPNLQIHGHCLDSGDVEVLAESLKDCLSSSTANPNLLKIREVVENAHIYFWRRI